MGFISFDGMKKLETVEIENREATISLPLYFFI